MTGEFAKMSDDRPLGLVDYVAKAVTKAMFEGALEPGHRLSPERLASDLGVSHIPVREALTTLRTEGLVTYLPRRGFFVPELSLSELQDCYRMRRILESEAHRSGVPKLNAGDVDHLIELNEAMVAATHHNDRATFGALNRLFHFRLFQRAESVFLVRFLEQLWNVAVRYQATLLRIEGPSMACLQEHHDEILRLAIARDPDGIDCIMERHRGTLFVEMQKLLEQAPCQVVGSQKPE